MINKGLCILLLLWLLCVSGAMAIDKGSVLVLQLKKGDIRTFYLMEKPEIILKGDRLFVRSSNTSVNYLRSTVEDFHFVDSSDFEDSIDEVEKDELRFVYQNTEEVSIYGLKESDNPIKVYDINGRQCQVQISYQESSANISLGTLNIGVYIIRIGNRQSIKITKR